MALVGAAVWFITRRRKRQQQQQQHGHVGSDPATAEAAPYAAGHQQQHGYSPVPPSATIAPSELAGDRDYQTPPPPQATKEKPTAELDSNPNPTTFYELDGSGTHK